MQLIDFVLSISSMIRKNVVALIDNIVSTDKALATELNIEGVGCASHCFNLAVIDIISKESDVVDKRQAIMTKFRNLILAAHLAS